MGCGPLESTQPETIRVKIWGDYFSQDTRALLAVTRMAKTDIEFVLVDTLKKHNFEQPYIEQNPNATIPMLSHGSTKVIGDCESIFNYLVNTNEQVRTAFFDEKQSRKINELMNYFTRTIRRVTSKLIQTVVNPVVFDQRRKLNDAQIS